MITHKHVSVFKKCVRETRSAHAYILCQFCACVYFAASLENYFFIFYFLTYIYLSKHKYNMKYKVPHKTTQDERYVHK